MAQVLKCSKLYVAVWVLMGLSVDLAVSQPDQYRVRGTVLNAESGESIPGVNVYISQTTIGTVTKSDGSFEFVTNLAGVHTLVFSYVGYKTETRELNFYNANRPYFEVRLKSEPLELDPVEVTGSNKEWEKNLEVFTRNFIGIAGTAMYTEIENPWVIGFEEGKEGTLIARSERPLIIYNYALGYRIQVDLVDFRWPRSGGPGYYLFYANYKEMKSQNDRERKRWERNRRDVYLGSFEHFLKSLYAGSLKENDFDVVVPGTHDILKIPAIDSMTTSRLRLYANIPGLRPQDVKAYRLRMPVDVLYGKRWFNTRRERSRLVPTGRAGIFLVSKEGKLVNPISLRLDGLWSYDRLANLLPVDYSPE